MLRRVGRVPELAELCTTVVGTRFKYSTEVMINALRQTNGNISQTANVVGCARLTVITYIDRIPEIREVYMEETERLKDLAVTRLYEAVDRGEPWAVRLAILYHDSLFRLYAGEEATKQASARNGGVDLEALSDEQLDQLYAISQRIEGYKEGVIEAQVD